MILFYLFIAHFLADYTWLSNQWMLNAKAKGSPLFPIYVHSLVHGILIFLIVLLFSTPEIALLCFLIETHTHFLIDVAKGKIAVFFPSTANIGKKIFWITLGIDQTLHSFVLIWIYFIVN